MSKKPKLVYLEWEDAGSPEAGWMDLKEIKVWQGDKAIVKSVGFLLEENKKFIVIAADNMDDVFNGITKIVSKIIV